MIKLSPLVKTNVTPFYSWINDEEVIKYSLSSFKEINTNQEVDRWFEKTLEDTRSINLGIYLNQTNQLIGYAGISGISKLNRSGEFFIFIGEKRCWGQGIGTEVTRQILKLGFSDFGFNRIMLTVSEPNIGGIKAYVNAGFKIEGRLRQACYRDGEFHDKIVMAVLKSEWEK
ncbi:GNAT family protein [Pontibacter sp. BT731]|uniref:GNAT family N-acetyltransferase n=1 Tax=Pontibacter coccineus TaxID=3063328 RepID=UPI0026E12876|nr:GNAT family protein [Pontibacter sp. BT731]MDO6391707.1 GNAT family protein [Pontibacter sp. BT731]